MRAPPASLWLASVAALLLHACGEGPAGGVPAAPPAAPEPATSADPGAPSPERPAAPERVDALVGPRPGSIVGRVLLEGRAHRPTELSFEGVRTPCHRQSGMPLDRADRSLIVDREGGVANVVVGLSVPGLDPPTPERALVQWKAGRLEPHVQLVPAGSPVQFENQDACAHTLRTDGRRNSARNLQVAPGASHHEILQEPERISIRDDLHPWIRGYVVVTDSPLTRLTGPDGAFEISGLPPGRHRLELWHERLGTVRQVVEVAPGAVTPVELEMRPW